MKTYYVYIMSSGRRTLYVGVTVTYVDVSSSIKSSWWEGFTKRYNVTRLVYFEEFHEVREAIAREKQIKGWSRQGKIIQIQSHNPKWEDLGRNWFT